MESNRRPGKGTPKKKPSAAGPKSSSRTTRTGTARSTARSTKSDEDHKGKRTLKSPEEQFARRPIDKTSNEERPGRSSSQDRSARFDKDKPRSSEDRPRRSNSTVRSSRFESDKPRSNEDRPRRSSSPDRPSHFDSDKPRSSEDRPRRSSTSDRAPRRDYDKPGSGEDRPLRSSTSDRAPRRDYDKPGSGEDRPRRSSTSDRAPRRDYDKPGSGEDRPRRSGTSDRAPRREYDKPGSGEDRPRRSSTSDRAPRKYDRPVSSEDRPRRNSNTPPTGSNSGEGLIRLNKYIANSGICSRREADELITAGTVMVNGKVVTELGTKVSPADKVQYDNHTIRNERHVYVLLNKPKGYITTTDDPFDRKTVMALVEGACKERIYPVGRLDRNTTGLLLLTNDGEMAKKLTHPRHKVKKVYHVELDKALSKGDMLTIAAGVELDDGMAMIDEIAYASEVASKKEVGVELHSGKNRIVRRIFEAVGYEVVRLDRVIFAGLTKKDLPRGQWRILTEQEVNYLKMLK